MGQKAVKFEIINRDLSWLSFNARVLQEAADNRVPLIERVRFLGIFSNNLDEFFRVRVGTLKRMNALDHKSKKELGFDPRRILDKIHQTVLEQQKEFDRIFQLITKELEEKGVFHLTETDLSPAQGEFVRRYFHDSVRQNLFPILLDKKSRFPTLRDKAIYLAVRMGYSHDETAAHYALIEVPSRIVPRFLVLPKEGDKTFFMLLDDVLRYCLKEIFSNFDYDTFEAYTLKMTRDAELDIDNDIAQSFLEKISKSIKKRKQGQPVRFIYDSKMPKEMLQFISRKLKLSDAENIIAGARYHNFKDFIRFPGIDASLLNEPWPPLSHRMLAGQRSLFDVIRKKDVLLSFPFHSFDYLIDLLREAAIDPRVVSIQINLYRVGEKSKIVNALINAAKNGKQVTAVVELQARFDEENNIKLSRKLEEEGVKVIFGVPGLKVHSKLLLIARREKKKTQLYAHIGSGNFHDKNALIYGDHSLLTAHTQLVTEVQKVFDFFKRNYERANFKHLLVSPFNMRKRLTELIQEEIRHAREGRPAYILLKLNNLVDEEMIRKLYQASQSGVKIQLIVRGICSLIPGVKGMSENIEALSIVDRFLEHARVYVFGNNENALIYLSSADWMSRNLDGRIEVAVPVFDPDIRQTLLDILAIQLKGTSKARIIDRAQLNRYAGVPGKTAFRSQYETYKYLRQKHEED